MTLQDADSLGACRMGMRGHLCPGQLLPLQTLCPVPPAVGAQSGCGFGGCHFSGHWKSHSSLALLALRQAVAGNLKGEDIWEVT